MHSSSSPKEAIVTILHLDASMDGKECASPAISRSIVGQLTSADESERVVYRDLIADPLPHLADDSVLSEFLEAATVVIFAPMYTLPSQLRAWVDLILVAGRTFRYTGKGPEGLASGKRVVIALAGGGACTNGSQAVSLENLRAYLRGAFSFIGIEPEFIAADGFTFEPEPRELSREGANDAERTLPTAARGRRRESRITVI